ncbi:MAG: leucine-rich repeat protein [Lachnospiraceae bacterium]
MKKKYFSRVIGLILFACLQFCFFQSPIHAATIVEEGTLEENTEIKWALYATGTLRISGNGAIPEASDTTMPWEKLGDKVRTVVLEEGITEIGSCSFYDCKMKSISIPSSVKELKRQAFTDCPNLIEVQFSEGLITINKNAFLNCTKLEKLTIPKSVSVIGDKAFNNCIRLKEITIQNSDTEFGEFVFRECCSLQTVRLPDETSQLGERMFWSCSAMTSFHIPKSVTVIPKGLFMGCINLEEIQIPDGVTEIGEEAFYGCYNLRKIQIPEGLKIVGPEAFGDSGIRTICFQGTAPALAENSLANCGHIIAYYPKDNATWTEETKQTYGASSTQWVPVTYRDSVPGVAETVTGTYGTFSWTLDTEGKLAIQGSGAMPDASEENPVPWDLYRGSVKTVELGKEISSIGANAFAWCSSLETIELPNSVVSIGEGAFVGCSSLKTIELPKSLEKMEGFVFCDCIGLTEITIPEKVSIIPIIAFLRCRNLESIVIPANVTEIQSEAFEDCSSLKKIKFLGDAPKMDSKYVFLQVTADVFYPIENQTWTEEVKKNYGGNLTWKGCRNGSFGENLTWELTEDGTLRICGNGEIPNADAGSMPWSTSGISVKKVIIESGVTAIGESVFAQQNNLREILLPDSITTIGKSAFQGCTGLKEMTIPASVTEIKENAWAESGIRYLYFMGEKPTFEKDCLKSCQVVVYFPVENSGWEKEIVGATSILGCTATYKENQPFPSAEIESSLGNNFSWTLDTTGTLTIQGSGDLPDLSEEEGNQLKRYQGLIRSVILQEGITAVGKQMFQDTPKLEYVEFPSSLTDIGEGAFRGCKNLHTILLSNAQVIGVSAFENCETLEEVVLPNTVTKIQTRAFADCSSLKNITFQGEAPVMESDVFTNVTAEVIYPPEYQTWTSEVQMDYGGKLTWLAASSGTVGDNISWELNENGRLIIAGTGEIPNDKDNILPWKKLGDRVRYVMIENGITAIGNYAFMQCPMQSIDLPDSVTTIGTQAFTECPNLDSIFVSNSVKTIKKYAFSGCSALKIVTISGEPMIGDYAFQRCTALETVMINGTITGEVGINIFEDCTSLSNVKLSDTFTSFGISMFYNCKSLKQIEIPMSVTEIGNKAFTGSGLETVKFMGEAPTFGDGCFGSTTATILIPKECKSWTEEKKQNYDGNLTWKEYDGGTLGTTMHWELTKNQIEDQTEDQTKNQTFTISGQGEMPNAEDGILPWEAYKDSIQTVVIGEGITSICDQAFQNSTVSSASIPSSVQTIGQSAFYQCENLTQIDIREPQYWRFVSAGGMASGITTIGPEAFYMCKKLENLDFANRVQEIGSGAFYGCASLKNVEIPNGVTILPEKVFFMCEGLETVVIPDSVTSIGEKVFVACYKLKTLAIPDTVTVIGKSAFRECWELSDIHLPANLQSLGSGAFGGCAKLEQISIPNGVTQIEEMTFAFCRALKEIHFSENVTSIGDGAFYQCVSLKALPSMPNVTEIGEKAFELCDGLEKIEIPDGVQSIGAKAFLCCVNAKEAIIPKSVTSIGDSAFWGCENLTKVSVNITNPHMCTVSSSVFQTDEDEILPNLVLFVPDESVAAFKSDITEVEGNVVGWGVYKDHIRGVNTPEVPSNQPVSLPTRPSVKPSRPGGTSKPSETSGATSSISSVESSIAPSIPSDPSKNASEEESVIPSEVSSSESEPAVPSERPSEVSSSQPALPSEEVSTEPSMDVSMPGEESNLQPSKEVSTEPSIEASRPSEETNLEPSKEVSTEPSIEASRPSEEINTEPSFGEESEPVIPSMQPSSKPSAKPSTKPSTKPSEKPSVVKPSLPTKKEQEKNALSLNKDLKVSQTGSKLQISWGKVMGAKQYSVYVQYCGKDFSTKTTATVKGKTAVSVSRLKGKKLDLKKNFKVYVTADTKISGKKALLGRSLTAHVVGSKNTKLTNAKGIKLTNSSYSLKKGKTVVVKAKTLLVDKKKHLLSDAHGKEFRYASSDKKVATVSEKGKIKAVGKGKCSIYVYSRNGYAKKATITVR